MLYWFFCLKLLTTNKNSGKVTNTVSKKGVKMKTSEIVKEIMEIFVKPKKHKQHIQEIIGDLSKGEVGILAYLLNEKNNIS